MSTDPDRTIQKPPVLEKDWRFYVGMVAMLLSCIMPLFALFVPLLGLSATQSTAIVGLLVAGGPEVVALIGVALLGKDTFEYFIFKMKKFFRDTWVLRPASKRQYYLGLTIAVLSWLPMHLYSYFPAFLPSGSTRIYILVAADISFIISMFIMGGEFWEKLRRIFVWEGKV